MLDYESLEQQALTLATQHNHSADKDLSVFDLAAIKANYHYITLKK